MSNSKYNGEQVFSVPTHILRSEYPGFFQKEDSFVLGDHQSLYGHGQFIDRDSAEVDPSFKQIIPYALIVQNGKVLTYKRGKVGAERRLHAKRSIGVGGHINPEDIPADVHGGHPLSVSLLREFKEEIGVEAWQVISVRPVGIVNEDSAEVGRVHLGLVYVVRIDDDAELRLEDCLLDVEFLIQEQLKDPEVLSSLEGWSQLVVADLHQILGD